MAFVEMYRQWLIAIVPTVSTGFSCRCTGTSTQRNIPVHICDVNQCKQGVENRLKKHSVFQHCEQPCCQVHPAILKKFVPEAVMSRKQTAAIGQWSDTSPLEGHMPLNSQIVNDYGLTLSFLDASIISSFYVSRASSEDLF